MLRYRLSSWLIILLTACTASGGGDTAGETTGDGSGDEGTSDGVSTSDGGIDTGSHSSTDSDDDASSGDTDSGVTGSDSDTDGDSTSDSGDEIPDGLPAGVFGGGSLYHDAETVVPRIRASGFQNVVIWTIHVYPDGRFVLNETLIFEDGEYVGDPGWPALVASLEEEPTSVRRVEVGIGSYGTPGFEHIQALIEAEGTGPDSMLYRNFQALRETLPNVDAINYDDESNYHVDSTVQLSAMLAELGFQITLTPYTARSFWQELYEEMESTHPGVIDRVMLQIYAGGAGNDPSTWNQSFGDLVVEAGLWSLHGAGCSQGDSPAAVQSKLEGWGDEVRGAWMWVLDDMLACDDSYPLEDYADAIGEVFGP